MLQISMQSCNQLKAVCECVFRSRKLIFIFDVSSKQRLTPYIACLRVCYKMLHYKQLPLRGDSGKFIGRYYKKLSLNKNFRIKKSDLNSGTIGIVLYCYF